MAKTEFMRARIMFDWAGNVYDWDIDWPLPFFFLSEKRNNIIFTISNVRMKEKQLRKVIHVHFIHGHKNYYFGSVSALFRKFSEKELGCTEASLRHILSGDGNAHITHQAIFFRSRLLT